MNGLKTNQSLLVLSSQTYCMPMAMLIQINIVQLIFPKQFMNISLFNQIEMQLSVNENGRPFGKKDKKQNLPERICQNRRSLS